MKRRSNSKGILGVKKSKIMFSFKSRDPWSSDSDDEDYMPPGEHADDSK